MRDNCGTARQSHEHPNQGAAHVQVHHVRLQLSDKPEKTQRIGRVPNFQGCDNDLNPSVIELRRQLSAYWKNHGKADFVPKTLHEVDGKGLNSSERSRAADQKNVQFFYFGHGTALLGTG